MPGNPPRIAGSTLNEYRHLQFFSKEYNEWVRDNIKPIEYVNETAVLEIGWDEVREKAARGEPEVVMVTQATVSRLLALALFVREWDGPVTLTMYIEYLAGTAEAEDCKESVVEWFQRAYKRLWPEEGTSPPLSVQFLYTAFPVNDASCELPTSLPVRRTDIARSLSGTVDAQEEAGVAREEVRGEDGGVLWQPNSQWGRRLRAEQYSRISDPGGGPAVTDAWHYWPNRWFHRLRGPARPWQDEYDSFHPVNALRNVAWSQVPSGAFVFLNDIDLIPTPDLHYDLVHGKFADELSRMRAAYFERGEREAFVVPAFERLKARGGNSRTVRATPWPGPCEPEDGCEIMNGMALPRNFDMLRKMVQQETVVDVFYRKQFHPGHGCYSWFTWLQEEEPEEMLEMVYANPCEPYVIALSDATPRYDPRFRGRGQNKVEQLTHMAMWGFRWRVLPAHFVLHVPHESKATYIIGWDEATTPLVLMKLEIQEIEQEPEFRRHIVQPVPIPVKIE